MIRPVLLLGTEPRIVVPIARSLRAKGIAVALATSGEPGPAAHSRFISEVVRLPAAEDCFLSALCDAIARKQFDMLIPTSDSTLLAVARGYEELQSRLQVCCPPPAIVDLVLDKQKTLVLAQELGIAIPATYSIHNAAALLACREQLRFPLVAKPIAKDRLTGFKVLYFSSSEKLELAFAADPLLGSKVLFQEYCSGEGVGINLLLHHGRPIVVFQHRRLKELPSTGGVSVLAISEPVDTTLQEQALRLLTRMRWEGVAMVEFRQDRASGRAVLMEVNGRYWGSIAAPLTAGIHFPYYQWQLSHGQVPQVPASYPSGVRTRWFAGDLLRLHELWRPSSNRIQSPPRVRELLRFLSDFRTGTSDMVFSLSDPLPGMLELAQVLRTIAASEVKRLLRKLVPAGWREQIAFYRALGWRLAWRCFRLQRLHQGGARAQRVHRLVPGARSFLFVCQGNIVRSPLAAALFRRRLPAHLQDVQVMSAGAGTYAEGRSDPRAQAVATRFNVSLDGHKSKWVTPAMLEAADVVLAMDVLNEATLWQRFPRFRDKVLLLAEVDEHAKSLEIEDPYDKNEEQLRACSEQLSHYVDMLIALLDTGGERKNSGRPGR